MSGKLPADPILVGEFQKNSREVVRVILENKYELNLLNIRAFYKDADSGEFKPGKGIAIQVDQFGQLASVLAKAGQRLKELQLL